MKQIKAPRGEKTITCVVTLWADRVHPDQVAGSIVPKMVHDHGGVYVRANPSHGIKSLPDNKSAVFFDSLQKLPQAIEQLAERHGMTLVRGGGVPPR